MGKAQHGLCVVYTKPYPKRVEGEAWYLSFQALQNRKHSSEPIREEMSPDCL